MYVLAGLLNGGLLLQSAQAGGAQYTLFYPSDKVDEIKKAIDAKAWNDPTNNGLQNTAVYAKDGIWGSKPVMFRYDTTQADINPQDLPSGKTRQLVFSSPTFYCVNGKLSQDAGGGNPPAIIFAINAQLQNNFSQSSSLSGFSMLLSSATQSFYVGGGRAGGGSITQQVDFNSLPGGCKPGNLPIANLSVSNWQLSHAAQQDFGQLQSTAQVDTANSDLTDPASSQNASDANACSAASLGLGWLVCGPIEMIDSLVRNTFQKLVKDTLQIDPLNGTGGDAGIYNVWNNFRTLANALLVVVFLVIIFANMITI